jgi:homoserine O-acetyltransferase/O-succinyltransferase
MISYRSAAEWTERFGRERTTDGPGADGTGAASFGPDFEVESYLEAHANKFVGTFDANCYLYLSRAMDLFDVADHGGSVPQGLSTLKLQRAMVIGVESDFLFPVEQQQELAYGLGKILPDVAFHRLPSIQGHDSFLVDMDRFRPVIADYFRR